MAHWSRFCPSTGEPHIKLVFSCLSCNAVNPNYIETVDLTEDPAPAMFIQTQRGTTKTYGRRPPIPSAEHLHQTSLGQQPLVQRAPAPSQPTTLYRALVMFYLLESTVLLGTEQPMGRPTMTFLGEFAHSGYL